MPDEQRIRTYHAKLAHINRTFGLSAGPIGVLEPQLGLRGQWLSNFPEAAFPFIFVHALARLAPIPSIVITHRDLDRYLVLLRLRAWRSCAWFRENPVRDPNCEATEEKVEECHLRVGGDGVSMPLNEYVPQNLRYILAV